MTLAPETPTSGLVKGKVFDLGKMNHRGDPEYGVLGQLGLNADELNPGEEVKHKTHPICWAERIKEAQPSKQGRWPETKASGLGHAIRLFRAV